MCSWGPSHVGGGIQVCWSTPEAVLQREGSKTSLPEGLAGPAAQDCQVGDLREVASHASMPKWQRRPKRMVVLHGAHGLPCYRARADTLCVGANPQRAPFPRLRFVIWFFYIQNKIFCPKLIVTHPVSLKNPAKILKKAQHIFLFWIFQIFLNPIKIPQHMFFEYCK